MSSISAGTSAGTALVSTGDTTGALVIKTGGSATTAATFNADQTVTLAAPLPIASGGTGGSATPTAGGVVYGTGTVQAVSAAGTSGQLLQSNGASAPTWVTPATPTSGLTLVQTVTASGSTVVINGFSSTYDNYILVIRDLYPAADNRNLEFKFYLGGTLITGNYQYAYSNVSATGANSNIGGQAQDTIRLANSMDQTTFNRSNQYLLNIFGVNGASTYKSVLFEGVYHFSDFTYSIRGAGTQTVTTGALTGLQFSFPGSSFGGGTFQLYGFAKA